MAKIKIHQRTSTIDRDTKIVNVTKEKSPGETLFGEQEGSKRIQSGTYRIHERDSLLDKDTKVVTVTKEKTLGETLFGTEEENRQKELESKRKYEQDKINNKRYLEEQNQKMIKEYNDLVEQETKYNQEQVYNNKVVGTDFTEGISSKEVSTWMKNFDYSSISKNKKEGYLKFIANYLNSLDKGYSIHFIKLEQKKKFSKNKKIWDGPKYWEIKKDEKEYELNKGSRFSNEIIVIDENGEFWKKHETILPGLNKYTKTCSFNKIEKLEDENIAYLDISLKNKKIDLNLEKYLKINDSEKEKMLNEAKENWTDENNKLKKLSNERLNKKKLINTYNILLLVSKIIILPLILLPIPLVFMKAPLFLIIAIIILSSGICGFIKDYFSIATTIHLFCTIVATILTLIRGYDNVLKFILIMIVISIAIHFILYVIENKMSEKIQKIDLYN